MSDPRNSKGTDGRITKGDVEAVFNAFGNGGRAVLAHSRTAEGAPADETGVHGSIRPFAGSVWDGAHFKADDWHVILIADFEGGDRTFTHNEAKDIIDGLRIDFTLDGAPLPTTRTPVKRFLDPPPVFGFEEAYYAQQGRIMAPGELARGTHTLDLRVTDPAGGVLTDGITFVVE
jgi:hypothetical protein